MRRKDQPRRPKAIICCRLSSLNTLLMPLQASLPRSAVNVPRDYFSMAGFEVTIYGRFWVTPEGGGGLCYVYGRVRQGVESLFSSTRARRTACLRGRGRLHC